MIRIFTSFVLVICFGFPTLAQKHDSKKSKDQDSKTKDLLEKAKQDGRQLQINVSDNVSAQAVLIPQVDARRIFGKEIADHYAVVEVNVGNKSPDAALIIHDIFIDYSRWALSGTTPGSEATVQGLAREHFSQFQTSTSPTHVASEEYRVVRGQLLDAQLSTKRNKIIRWLSLAGTVAAAYSFSIGEEGFIKGIAEYNGAVLPGISAAFPDQVIPQLNRVSDLGFQTNKVIPKQGAEVIVCFFPIEKFLTPGFRRLFLKSPALFFAPLQMLIDRTIQGDVENVLGDDLGLDANSIEDANSTRGATAVEKLRNQLPCYLHLVRDTNLGASQKSDPSFRDMVNQTTDTVCLTAFGLEKKTDAKGNQTIQLLSSAGTSSADTAKKFAGFVALDYINQASLGNVTVTIDGVMSVDTTAIAAKIEDVTFDDATDCGGPDKECFWSVPADGSVIRTGNVSGSYLTSGSVVIEEASDLGITSITPITDGSSDQELHFSFKLTQSIPSGKTLTFKVTKPKQGATGTIDSQPWIYAVGFQPGTPTVNKSFDQDSDTVTLTNVGPDFTKADPLVVTLMTPGQEVLKTGLNQRLDNGKMVVTIPAANQKTAGCWRVLVKSTGRDVRVLNGDMFEVPRSPTLVTAKVQGVTIVVSGTDLLNTESCDGKSLAFQLVKDNAADADKPLDAPINSLSPDGLGAGLQLTDEAKEKIKDGTWKVRVLLGGTPVKDAQTALQK